ncbi:MAG TPA: family 20 glycosylhydrolase [Ktedonobacterales bacterium]|nr:family 20 glycosylhydrolase [Ktedonobacterales bacterium]
MKRFTSVAIVALVLTSLFAGLVFLVVSQARPQQAQPTQSQTNPPPQVIPSLREWHGENGAFALIPSSRIVLDTATGDQFADTAHIFATDLTLVTGHTLPIVTSSAAGQGDIFLSLATTDQTLGDEGYSLSINDRVELRAQTATGVFYGTRTILQMLLCDAAKAHLPRGSARDYPSYHERGFMLDVGRKFFPLSELKEYVRAMSYFKLNDFHLHLNDNQLIVGTGPDWTTKYAAFRLSSPRFPGLAAKDGAYTRQDMRELQDFAKQYGVTITPEIDVPAHALALTQFRPDLASPTLDKSLLDLSNPNTLPFVKSLWDEFLPWFDSRDVHIGADEYDARAGEAYRQFVNACDDYLKGKGYTVHAWGSLAQMKGTTPIHTNVVMDVWDTAFASAPELVHEGYHVVNAIDTYLYIVPKAGVYNDYLDTRTLYERWDPTIFDLRNPAQNLQPNDAQLLGAKFAVWNDKLGTLISDADVAARVLAALPIVGGKFWGPPARGMTYAQFTEVARTVGQAPGLNLPTV